MDGPGGSELQGESPLDRGWHGRGRDSIDGLDVLCHIGSANNHAMINLYHSAGILRTWTSYLYRRLCDTLFQADNSFVCAYCATMQSTGRQVENVVTVMRIMVYRSCRLSGIGGTESPFHRMQPLQAPPQRHRHQA